ncbi:hypothetical protein [Streptomyces sp. Rer75]|uniref:hypothetical protein n=1 Tax=unclassified Streptomyces TaxID=2593676 RepID=UPI0015D01B1C|nr:hypothetical protein [Streptomyces sp. Rer75]QLH20688.1 hypothetical protein HYQ63_08715 [Streptomyces sp. Rer75]
MHRHRGRRAPSSAERARLRQVLGEERPEHHVGREPGRHHEAARPARLVEVSLSDNADLDNAVVTGDGVIAA